MCVHMYYYQQSVNIVKTTGVSASRNVSNMAPLHPANDEGAPAYSCRQFKQHY